MKQDVAVWPRLLAALVVGAGLYGTDARVGAAAATGPYGGYTSPTYADPAHWLCRPDRDDVCDGGLDATIVRANGRTRVERWRSARRSRIDCFYVYPTISTDPTGNSDLVPGADQELYVVHQQAARLGAVCRVFAPVYRQVTLTALVGALGGGGVSADRTLAYADVLDAWKHYVANDSDGRGVILIGHSQGAGLLAQLIAQEIDPNPALRSRLVSAMLLGTSLQVPVGADVGGDFQHVPLCRTGRQTGCAVSYASFRSTVPPPPDSRFGVSRRPGWQAACTNPASLRSQARSAPLRAYLPNAGRALPLGPTPAPPAWLDPATGVTVSTPYVTLPGFLRARCAERAGFSYLEITVDGDPADPRIDDLRNGDLTPDWGLHLVDVNLAMGNLVSLARRQAAAYCARRRCARRR